MKKRRVVLASREPRRRERQSAPTDVGRYSLEFMATEQVQLKQGISHEPTSRRPAPIRLFDQRFELNLRGKAADGPHADSGSNADL